MKVMTYEELKAFLDTLTPEQLKQEAKVSDHYGEMLSILYEHIIQEDEPGPTGQIYLKIP